MWPSIVPIPIANGKLAEIVTWDPSDESKSTGSAPLAMSVRKTIKPIFHPRILKIFVAPILPLPFFWMSMPFALPTRYPNGTEPIM